MATKNVRSIVVGSKLWGRLKSLGVDEERSMSDLVREALRDFLRKKEVETVGTYDPVSDSIK